MCKFIHLCLYVFVFEGGCMAVIYWLLMDFTVYFYVIIIYLDIVRFYCLGLKHCHCCEPWLFSIYIDLPFQQKTCWNISNTTCNSWYQEEYMMCVNHWFAMEDAKKCRTIAKRLFTRAKNGILQSMLANHDADIIESRFTEFTKKYNDVLEKKERKKAEW